MSKEVHIPEHTWLPDMFWSQSFPWHEFIAISILKSAEEVGGTAIVLEDLEISQLIGSVHNKLCFPAIDPH